MNDNKNTTDQPTPDVRPEQVKQGHIRNFDGTYEVYATNATNPPDRDLRIQRNSLRLAWGIVGALINDGIIDVNMLEEEWHLPLQYAVQAAARVIDADHGL